MEEWKEYKLGDVCSRLRSGKSIKADFIFNTGKYPVIGGNGVRGYADESNFVGQAVVIGRQGAYCGNVRFFEGEAYMTEHAVVAVGNEHADTRFLACLLSLMHLGNLSAQSAQPGISVQTLSKQLVRLPSISYQKRVSAIIKSLDDKIEVNRRINDNFVNAIIEVMLIWFLISLENDNLEQQAMAIFDKVFPAIASGEDTIGSMITPKRGKGLLSKDAVEGNVPVVAGGLEPASYHNESNTIAPVVTISASGANAGYVNLWHIPVWSSDSSFIDATMSSNVYFWYVMLKKRQKEIFDAQTGSAQPHIYPKHIAEMPLGKFEQSDVEKFTEIVTPMFETRGKNLKESERLAAVRDSLLPKLMSGELNLDKVNV